MIMVKIEDSVLYKYLVFLKGIQTNYNVKEIFNLILGYQMAMNSMSIRSNNCESWISDFNTFVDDYLINKYYDNSLNKLPRNFGDVIFENQKSDSDGLKLFFEILDLYMKRNS